MSRNKESEYRANLFGTEFTGCPPQQNVRAYIAGQIVQAFDFPAEEMFINYSIDLGDWKREEPEEISGLSEEDREQFNCLGSVTHSATAVEFLSKQGKYVNHFHYCFPIDLQLVINQEKLRQRWPVIHFELSTVDSWERHYVLGCGYVEIPREQGLHNVTVQTWKPYGGLQSKISQFFIGGSSKVKHLYKISQPQAMTDLGLPGPNNRILYHTQSTGQVVFRFNVALQSRKYMMEERREAKDRAIKQKTEAIKEKDPKVIAPFVNTGISSTNRYTNTTLQQ